MINTDNTFHLPSWMRDSLYATVLERASVLTNSDLISPDGYPIKEGDHPLGEADNFVRRMYTVLRQEEQLLQEANPSSKDRIDTKQDRESHEIIKLCKSMVEGELRRAFESTDLRNDWIVVKAPKTLEPLHI